MNIFNPFEYKWQNLLHILLSGTGTTFCSLSLTEVWGFLSRSTSQVVCMVLSWLMGLLVFFVFNLALSVVDEKLCNLFPVDIYA